MKEYKIIFSTLEPTARNCIWAKPVVGGFTLYMLQRGISTPLRVVDDKKTPYIHDDMVVKLETTPQGTIDVTGLDWDDES